MSGRRFTTAVRYGGGVGVLGASTLGILAVEGMLARRTVGPPASEPPDVNGRYVAEGVDENGTALTLAVIGDSSAAGLGAYEPAETPGGQIALGLSAAAGRPVQVHSVARIGAQSGDLAGQVSATLAALHPDVAVILIGVNDVTHLRWPPGCARELAVAIRRLRAAGSAVVVGTCPDLGMISVIPQPLRSICRASCRQLAKLQAIACVEAGARAVSLGDLLGPAFAQRPHELFSQDRFHPSAAGYAAAAEAMLPSVVGAVGVELAGEEEQVPEGVLPVALAAAEASRDPGTEVMRGEIAGRERGPRGRFAALRRRHPTRPGEQAEPTEAAAG